MTENIETLLKESRVYRPTAKTIAAAHIKDYEKDYQKSIADPEAFWSGMAKELDWFSPWSTVLEWNYPWAKWFVGATCNITYNCLDRHVKTWRKNKVALIWVGEDDRERIFTYGELYRQVNRCANALKKLGMRREDTRVIVQGFGNVGSNAANLMYESGYKVIGIAGKAIADPATGCRMA